MAEAGVAGQESETITGILCRPERRRRSSTGSTARSSRHGAAGREGNGAKLGFDSVANKPEEFAAYIKTEMEKWGKVVKDAKMRIE